MGKTYSEIEDGLRQFIEAQKMFFVATAPAGTEGHINLSPKGLDTLRILGPKTVAYLDYTGSGIETIAHLRENGRIVVMLCAFDGPPKIVRLYGRGRAIEPHDAEWAALVGHFTPLAGTRAIILVELDRIADSCGFAVPLYRFEGDRSQLIASAERKGAEGTAAYQRKNNAASIDGLPGLHFIGDEQHGG
jgi:pyridoxamine 5'-phosphate oxidase-like protein